MPTSTHVAVDLGASGGRVMLGRVGPERLDLHASHRFDNAGVPLPTGLHWDVVHLHAQVLEGLRRVRIDHGPPTSIGIDSWAIDFGLLDAEGALLGPPFHYRDRRGPGAVVEVDAALPRTQQFAITGLQHLPFTTHYQLAAARGTAQLDAAATLLLIPDLLTYLLGGVKVAELTNASTTGLLDLLDGTWSDEVARAIGLDRSLLPPIVAPGTTLGGLRSYAADATGLAASVPMVAVASHDTASAVVGVPATTPQWAYISSGTWSLVGVELEAPRLDVASRRAGFTNELGVDGTVRYLRNVMGLWMLQQCLATWERAGEPADLQPLLRAAGELPAGGPVIDVDAAAFIPPGDMPERIRAACADAGQPVPHDRASLVRCVLDSLAAAYARTLASAAELSGRDIDAVHVVGGGARNALLCQLTADATGLPVIAGPVEATALGNVLVQARTTGGLGGDLRDLRGLVAATHATTRYLPRGRGRAAS